MKKTSSLFILIFLLVTLNANAQNNEMQLVNMEIVNLGDGQQFAHKKDKKNEPIDGKVRIITGVTTEYIDAIYNNGYPEGTWNYYRNNKLSQSLQFKNGYYDGEQKSYSSFGEVDNIAHFKMGKKDGKWEYFDAGGTKNKEEFFDNDQPLKYISYYPNKQIETERNFKDGMEHGPYKAYNREGKLVTDRNYVKGALVGKQYAFFSGDRGNYTEKSNYNSEGQLHGAYLEEWEESKDAKQKGQYINGKKDGKWTYAKGDGSLIKEEVFEKGDVIKRTTFYTNGNIDTERGLKNGKEHGVTKNYSLDGDLKLEKNFVMGKEVGKQIAYISSNQGDFIKTSNYNDKGKQDGPYLEEWTDKKTIKTKGQYINGQKDGKWVYGYPSSLYKEETYKNGSLLESKKIEKQ